MRISSCIFCSLILISSRLSGFHSSYSSSLLSFTISLLHSSSSSPSISISASISVSLSLSSFFTSTAAVFLLFRNPPFCFVPSLLLIPDFLRLPPFKASASSTALLASFFNFFLHLPHHCASDSSRAPFHVPLFSS